MHSGTTVVCDKFVIMRESLVYLMCFSWDEMAKYDLNSTINFAVSTTQSQQIYYIGHSEGTMTAFAAFGDNPVLGAKVRS